MGAVFGLDCCYERDFDDRDHTFWEERKRRARGGGPREEEVEEEEAEEAEEALLVDEDVMAAPEPKEELTALEKFRRASQTALASVSIQKEGVKFAQRGENLEGGHLPPMLDNWYNIDFQEMEYHSQSADPDYKRDHFPMHTTGETANTKNIDIIMER